MNLKLLFRLLYLTAFLVVGWILFHSKSKKIDLLSLPQRTLYHNDLDSVQSIIELDTSQNITINYTLRGSNTVPYVGLAFEIDSQLASSLVDYDFIRLTLHSRNEKIIPVILNEKLENCFIKGQKIDRRQRNFDLHVDAGTHDYEVAIEDFSVPYWWLSQHDVANADLPAVNVNNIVSVALQNDIIIEKNIPDSYTVINFTINKSFSWYYFLFPLLILMCVEIVFLMKREKITKIEIAFEPIAIKNAEKKDEWSVLQSCIAKNINQEELQLDYIEKETGIKKKRVSELIKQHTDLTLKKYINHIRMHEAVRLLETTDLNMSEIAYQVGFSNVTHFNRVFKEMKGCSPSEYQNKLVR